MSYYIFSDVSLDIDRDFAQENDIRYVPMEYVLGEDTFYCKAPESDEMMHEYYDKLRNKITTHTSQITPNHYIELFEPYVKEGTPIVYLSLSSGLSNTYESALMAVKMLGDEHDDVKIEVVDTLGATGGMGLMVESAVANRKAGMGYKENAEWLRNHTIKLNYYFKVEDLMYLKRGGRVSAATAIVGTALNIKPILTIDKQGKLQTIDKKRGNRQALKAMVETFDKRFDPAISNVVYISCADCIEDAKILKDMVIGSHKEAYVRITMLSPIIGAHTGPDMLSLIYYGSDREY